MNKILLTLAAIFVYNGSVESQTLFGITFNGGVDSLGTISKFVADTKELTVLKSLGGSGSAPASGLVQASDGKLYGLASTGGVNNFCSIYSYDPISGVYTDLKSLADINGRYATGTLIEASDGKLYGMTNGGNEDNHGILFSYDPNSSVSTKLFDFSDDVNGVNGSDPYGSLMQGLDGKLYGMTCDGGTDHGGIIFSFDITTATFTKLVDLPVASGLPKGNLVQAADGKLYGWSSGGVYNEASIFSFDPVTLAVQWLYDSHTENDSYGSLMLASDGNLYGMAIDGGSQNSGFIFSFNPSLSTYNKLMDFDSTTGQFPVGTLMQSADGKLYGMTKRGGNYDYGTIFSFDLTSSTFSKLTDFNINIESYPVGSLMQAKDGKLYGVRGGEDLHNRGAIFSFDPLTRNLFLLSTFPLMQSASNISGSLMRASDGKLYGMSTNGGNSRGGVLFSFDPISQSYTELHNLDYVDGHYPFGSLIQGKDKKLYGITPYGGIYDALAGNDEGVLFSYDFSSGIYSKLFTFNFYGPLTGSNPYGSLLQANDGKLYGMTSFGGVGSHGVGGGFIFSFDPTSSTYTTLFHFADDLAYESNGSYPYGSVIEGRDGKLYGMTSLGGDKGDGVVFSYDPSSGNYNKLVDFDSTNGSHPYGSLIQARDGKLYGMTWSGGTDDAGVIFSYDLNSAAFTRLKDFDFTNGSHPYGNLMQASDGKLYGMTNSGGTNDYGVIFSYDPVSSTYTKLKDYDGSNGANPYFGAAFIELGESIPTAVQGINDLEELKVMPNPNNGQFSVRMKLNTVKEVGFTLFNLMGQVIYQSPTYHFSGIQIQQINEAKLPAGLYLLQTKIGTESFVQKIIVTR